MSVPYFCRRCSEMLTAEQEHCPFCDGVATPVDELIDQRRSSGTNSIGQSRSEQVSA
jgi:hypothetical protein